MEGKEDEKREESEAVVAVLMYSGVTQTQHKEGEIVSSNQNPLRMSRAAV